MCTLATCQCGRGCIFNSGPANCDAHGNCNNRICSSQRGASCFKEFRAVQKAGADPVRWILSSQGYEVPPGAVQIGVRPLRNARPFIYIDIFPCAVSCSTELLLTDCLCWLWGHTSF